MTRRVMETRWRIARTEERLFAPGRRPEDGLLAEHLARYRFLSELVGGRVLDVGCGTGYGVAELARGPIAREVVGIDVSADAIALARRYHAHPKASFSRVDIEQVGWERGLGVFDAVTALEVLEHLHHEEAFWQGVEATLHPGGALWISTPLGRGRGLPASDPFHVHQMRRGEIESLLRAGWEARIYGQAGQWIEPWTAGRRYYTVLARARRRADGRSSRG
ncbi:MAG: class I SAM-dependent methyltransferase [Candidatus Eisenbacteria bacterium]|nr:class I SAM-dependent methyltransferase [Candidatus Eisenbacteria bacterium]